MPMSLEAQKKLNEFAEASDGFALFGIMLNPGTGEMATYSSHGMPPGAVLGFLTRAVEQMVTAAANNELEYIGGDNALAQGEITQTTGGKIGLVH
jgi:hypothetical protein